jgi:hypothetical protein
MKKIIFVLIAVSLVYALTKTSPPYRFTANTAARASEVNADMDTLDHTIDKIIDTVNNAVLRFNPTTTSHDSVLKYLRVDTIRSNPDMDTIIGKPYIDSIRTTHIYVGDSVYVGKGARIEYSVSADSGLFNGVRCENDVVADSIIFNGLRGTASAKVDSLISKGIRATASIRGDSLISDKGARITNTVIADSANLNSAVRADRGIFDSIQIGGGSWITKAAIGGFVMELKDLATDVAVLNDSAHYYLFNDNVSLSIPLAFAKADTANGTIYKYKTTAFPDILRPTTLKTINMPNTTSFTWIGDGVAGEGSSVFKIPSSISAPCTLLVNVASFGSSGSGMTMVQSNISYSLD